MEENQLTEFALGDHSDEEIVAEFASATMPRELVEDLSAYLAVATYPLAVRSSSLLEDSHYQPFAGIFETHFLPNNHASLQARVKRLTAAIKLVYASVYCRNSRHYIEATGNRTEEEKMAVVVQKIVGRERDGYFYPMISGTARSYNFYSVGRLKPEEGIAYTALGLGKTIMEGENCLFFSPANSQVLPQFSTPQDYLRNTQREFFAVDMHTPSVFPEQGGEKGLIKLKILEAEKHGILKFVGSTYSADTMNVPVEMEFAVEINPDPDKAHEFWFLQIRPMMVEPSVEDISIYDGENQEILCKSDQALSNGRIDDVRDIVFVRSDNFDRANMVHMADHIGRFNQMFGDEKKPYMLVGPGRWGTADRWLGIPTKWDQISAARVIVEAAYGDFIVEPSFGTHFFQNLITFQIGYLTINTSNEYNFFDWDWLNSIEPVSETEYVRHVRLEQPLNILIDGRCGKAVVFKPNGADQD
jgi:hypothetical protein